MATWHFWIKLGHVSNLQQSASDEFHPEKYVDDTVARFQEILQKKIEGEQTVIAKGEAAPAKVIDLMEALKASLAGGGGAKEADATGRKAKAAPAAESMNGEAQGAGGSNRRGPTRAAPKSAGESSAGSPRARRRSSS